MKRIWRKGRRILAAALACLLGAFCRAPSASALHGEERYEFESLLDAQVYIQQCIGEMKDGFSFYLSNELLDEMSESELKQELLLMTGEARCRTHVIHDSWESVRIYMQPTYYPGTRIVQAWKNGRTDELSEEERQVLELALEIVEEEKAQSPTMLALEKRLHDWICQTVVYEQRDPDYEGESIQRVCSALGALLDGQANCQGYTDAFYLLGTLAGLTVGRQNGSDENGDSHIWNTIQWAGDWYAVDVTADDTDLDGEVGANYVYFNIGRDLCENALEWPEHYETADIADETDSTYFYFTRQEEKYGLFGEAFTELDELCGYVYDKRLDQGQTVIWAMLCDEVATSDDLHEALKKTTLGRGHKGAANWTVWTWSMGRNTYYMVRWNTF